MRVWEDEATRMERDCVEDQSQQRSKPPASKAGRTRI